MMTQERDGIAPFDGADGVWLRCAFHAHTTESDGWLSPEALRRYHAWAGYDVLAITDHDMYTGGPDGDGELLVIGGTEISLISPTSHGPLHVLGLGITAMPAMDGVTTLRGTCEAIRAANGIPYVAHPVWSGLLTDEMDGIELAAGIEIYNGSCEVEQGRAHADAHWDLWLSQGHRLYGIATDDLHYPGWDAFRAWTMVHARERSRAAVLEALEAGRFYATTGPHITELSLTDGKLTVRCTPARSITVLANPPYGARINAGHHELTYRASRLRTSDGQTYEGITDGDLLTGMVVANHPNVRYARVIVEDEQGRRAWSNPIWRDRLSRD
ncbi:MAG: CehA/McbA family metallohydrolase [Thermomicrobiales bacterium]|nr:CehA/McbA family metallohydrolase [Thermomicrobiales bacterium]